MNPCDKSISVSSPSGEEYTLNVWLDASWPGILAHLIVRQSSMVPMELWRTKEDGSIMPRKLNTTLFNHPETAELYDKYAVSLVINAKIKAAAVSLWTLSFDGTRFVQNSFVPPGLPAAYFPRPGEQFPPLVGEDFSFRTPEGCVYLWNNLQDFVSWAIFKGYASGC